MRRARLPVFPEGRLPPREPFARQLLIRSVAIAALAVGAAYLTWRGLYTIDLSGWWVSVPLYLAEIHAVFGLALFTFSLWDIDRRPNAGTVRSGKRWRTAVLIPTYNESREILIPTIAAALALEPDHETWVLDDGNRPEVRELAEELGASYLARTEHSGAKAGNINHALSVIDVEFVAIVDADHVAGPDFLRKTLGYFKDPRVAIVQTPQDFYNVDSFEHNDAEKAEDMYHEQQLFYRVIQPGKNRWSAAFWCGTSAVVRVAALREIGGVATDTVTEDIHTTIRLHRRGWKTVYHNQVLARGLAADTAGQYQLQRFRWGTGAMQVLRCENPLFISGLSLPQRLAYAATLSGWFDAWRSLCYVLLPMGVLFTGALPIRADPVVFGVAFCVTFGLQQIALMLLARGYHRFVLSIIFDLVRMTPNMLATLTFVWPGRLAFTVTPKGRMTDDDRARNPAPVLLVAVAVLSVAAAAWFFLSLDGRTPVHYENPWFAYGAAFWLAFNFALVLAAIGRVTSREYAPERRAAARFSAGLAATLDGRPCLIHEISLTGAQVSIERDGPRHLAPVGGRHGLTIGVLRKALSFGAWTRWHSVRRDGRVLLGLEFTPGQTESQARLALALLNRELPVRGALSAQKAA